ANARAGRFEECGGPSLRTFAVEVVAVARAQALELRGDELELERVRNCARFRCFRRLPRSDGEDHALAIDLQAGHELLSQFGVPLPVSEVVCVGDGVRDSGRLELLRSLQLPDSVAARSKECD